MEKEKKLTLEEALYFGFFILLSIVKGLGFYDGQKVFLLLIIPAFFLVLLKIFISPYTGRQWFMQIVLLLLTMTVYYRSGEKGILFMMFTILGMKNISIKKTLYIGLRVWAVCAVILSVISFTRLEDTIYRVHEKLGMGHIFRWSLGFTHPNILHITYLVLCAFIIYELSERYRFKAFLLLMAGNVLVFLYSISFTGFAITSLLLVGELYVAFRPRFCFVEKAVVSLVLPFCLLISFLLPLPFVMDSTSKLHRLNFLLNTRLWLARQYLVPECMSLFGQRMADLPQGTLAIDNSYVWGLINYGIIPFGLLMIAYLALTVDYSRKQKTRELIIIVAFLAAGYTEPLLFNTSFKNITLVFLGEFLFRQKEGAEEYSLMPGLRQKMETLFEQCYEKTLQWQWMRPEPYRWVKGLWKTHKKQMAAGIGIGMMLGLILCAVLYKEPKGYVVQRFYTDGLYETSVYLESEQDADYEGYRVMNYLDADTPMQIVDGKAVTLETVRYYTGSVLIGALAGYLLCVGTILLTGRERQ
ncbi:MAG: hypothetical protein NC231_09260 [Bacillus sp. (in: Bacteria)]|nr:hypothetical protein [Bacillus sp. (in: firmicutes)]MCM1425487.1 hypothetical protein [Eubacterium sp.]